MMDASVSLQLPAPAPAVESGQLLDILRRLAPAPTVEIDPLLDADAAATAVGLPRGTFDRWRGRGLMPEPDAQVGLRNYWRASSLRQALDKLPRPSKKGLPKPCADGRTRMWEEIHARKRVHPRTIHRLRREAAAQAAMQAAGARR